MHALPGLPWYTDDAEVPEGRRVKATGASFSHGGREDARSGLSWAPHGLPEAAGAWASKCDRGVAFARHVTGGLLVPSRHPTVDPECRCGRLPMPKSPKGREKRSPD